MAALRTDMINEQRMGRVDANNLTRLEGVVDLLDKKRARSEGRAEVRDEGARNWGKLGVAAGAGAGLPQLLEWLRSFLGG